MSSTRPRRITTPRLRRGFAFDDPAVGIEWPRDLELSVSERDRSAPALADIADTLPFG